MKSKLRILCVLMALVLSLGSIALMTGCNDSEIDWDGSWDFSLGEIPISPERETAMESESNTIRVVFPGNDPNNPNSQLNRAMHRFVTHNPDHRIDFIPVGWDSSQIQQIILASQMAGVPYDILYATATGFAFYYSSGLIQAWDDYLNYEWLTDPNVEGPDGNPRGTPLMNSEAIDNMFTRQGGRYAAVPWHNVAPFMAFYNRTYLEALDLEDPYDLWRRGEWTMEAMHDMAVAATRDTGNTGTPNYWGIATVYENIWINQNHTSFVTMDDQGKFQLNLDDPALTEALEMITDVYHARRSVQATPDPRTAFYGGNVLFFLSEFGETSLLQERERNNELPFDWDMVPLPFGPNNTDGVHMVFSHGPSMIAGTHNPHTTALVMEYIVQEGMMVPDDDIIPLEAHWEEMYELMLQNPFYSLYYDMVADRGAHIIQAARNGQDIAEAIERNRTPMQNMVDTANRNHEPIIGRRHDPYIINFNDWTDANLMVPERGQDFTTLELITGANAIDGTSLLISVAEGQSPRSGNTGMFMLNPNDFPLFHPAIYVVEFDLRVVGDLVTETRTRTVTDDDGNEVEEEYEVVLTDFFAAIARGDRGNVMSETPRWFGNQIEGDGVHSIRIELPPLLDNVSNFVFVMGGVHWADIVIDNLRISQLTAND